jgi:hypothetical protein
MTLGVTVGVNMFIGSASNILHALTHLSDMQTALRPIGMAVAFWGEGAQDILRMDRRYKLVCNLAAGGTNPKVIRELLQRSNVEVKHLPNLHAKVSVFEHGAIVSSANFSRSGLWFEGETAGGWDEAGYELSPVDASFSDVERWFEALFARSLHISEEVLQEAETAWNQRVIPEPTVADPIAAEPEKPPCMAVAPVRSVELEEDELFMPFIKKGHRFRMAAGWLIQVLAKVEDVSKPNSRYVSAYVAHMIWTQSGKPMYTKVIALPIVRKPSEIWDVAIKKSKTHGPRILALLEAVIQDDITPFAVRHWATRCLQEITK